MSHVYNNYKQSHKYRVVDKELYKNFLDTLIPLLDYQQLLFYKNGEKKYKVYIKGDKLVGLRCSGDKKLTSCSEIPITQADLQRLINKYACVEKHSICYRHPTAYIEIDCLNSGSDDEVHFVTVYDRPESLIIPDGCVDVTGELTYTTAYYAKPPKAIKACS